MNDLQTTNYHLDRIVFGSLEGKLQAAFAKLATLHKKQNFSFAIVTGNLFASEQDNEAVDGLLNGTIRVPLSTYFTVGTTPLPQTIAERIKNDEEVRIGSVPRIFKVTTYSNLMALYLDLRKPAFSREAKHDQDIGRNTYCYFGRSFRCIHRGRSIEGTTPTVSHSR